MKKNGGVTIQFVFVFILLFQGFEGCSDIGTEVDPVVPEISGSWIWLYSVGSISGGLVYKPPLGTIVKDTYSTHGSFFRERNDTLIVSSTYSISRTEFNVFVVYANNTPLHPYMPLFLREFVRIERDTLRLHDDGGDVYEHIFVRARK